MSEYQITCVTKPDRFSTHEHITHIGNTAAKWKLTRQSAKQMSKNQHVVPSG
jgi:hypothetical protein